MAARSGKHQAALVVHIQRQHLHHEPKKAGPLYGAEPVVHKTMDTFLFFSNLMCCPASALTGVNLLHPVLLHQLCEMLLSLPASVIW
jgi:hypothetical protein